MLTKAIIQKIDQSKNTCIVRIPLFEQASSNSFIEAEATICITPGIYNNLFAGDIVIVGFEENKMELPIVLGKLFLNNLSKDSKAGALFGDSLNITTKAILPCSTEFFFDKYPEKYSRYNTPKKLADAFLNLETTGSTAPNKYISKIYINSSSKARYTISGELFLYTKKDYTLREQTDRTQANKIRQSFLQELINRADCTRAECTCKDAIVCLGFFGSCSSSDGSTLCEDSFMSCTLCKSGMENGETRLAAQVSGQGATCFYFLLSDIYKIVSNPE